MAAAKEHHRPNEATDYSVSVRPRFDDRGGLGVLCAYAYSPSLQEAMLAAAALTEAWISAPREDNDPDADREPLVGFEITVASPYWPDPA